MTYKVITVFNNWDELYDEMKDLFFNDTRFYSYKPEAYKAMVRTVDEIKNNTQIFIDNPEEANKFFQVKDKALLEWFPYLSGGRAALLDMKFFNKEGAELTEEEVSKLHEAITNNDMEIQSNTYIKAFANIDTLKKLQEKPVLKKKM